MMHKGPMPPHERPEPQADRHEEMAAFEHHPMEPRHDREEKDHRPPLLMGQHDVIAVIILILMLGMNIGIKLYFKSRKDAKELVELEKKSLEQQLEYLKYQINPHFFMNTLNNIHALVDIDPERAKEMIVIMSRLMRHMLYEGSKSKIPLQREVDFLQNYTELMRIRYTDHVDITLTLPDRLPDAQIPPLLFITFVENAFKHGVSYRQQSFIRISLRAEGQRLHFLCTNSKRKDIGQCQTKNNHGGMGLNNILQRLTLLYGSDYQLEMNDGPDTYDVHLCLPLS
jgi:LytS/YehU family sensor histidine kinase